MDALDRLDKYTGATGGSVRQKDPLRQMSKAERMALVRARLTGLPERLTVRQKKRDDQKDYAHAYRAGLIKTRPYVRKAQSHTSKLS